MTERPLISNKGCISSKDERTSKCSLFRPHLLLTSTLGEWVWGGFRTYSDDAERVKTLFFTEKQQKIQPLFDIKAILDKWKS